MKVFKRYGRVGGGKKRKKRETPFTGSCPKCLQWTKDQEEASQFRSPMCVVDTMLHAKHLLLISIHIIKNFELDTEAGGSRHVYQLSRSNFSLTIIGNHGRFYLPSLYLILKFWGCLVNILSGKYWSYSSTII